MTGRKPDTDTIAMACRPERERHRRRRTLWAPTAALVVLCAVLALLACACSSAAESTDAALAYDSPGAEPRRIAVPPREHRHALHRRQISVNRPTRVKTLARRTTKRGARPSPTPSNAPGPRWPQYRPGAFNSKPVEVVFASNWGANRPGADVTSNLQRAINECFRRTVNESKGRCELRLGARINYRVTQLTIPHNMMDFTLVGFNSTLTFERNSMDPPDVPPDSTKDIINPPLIGITRCRRCEFKDLVIDWNWSRWRIASMARFLRRDVDSTNFVQTWRFNLTAPIPRTGLRTETFYAFQSIHPVDERTFSIGVQGQPEYYFVGANGTFFNGTRLGKRQAKIPQPTDLPPGAFDNPLAVVLPVVSIGLESGGLSPNGIATSSRLNIVFRYNSTTNNFGTNVPARNSLWMIKHLTYEVHGFRLQDCVNCFFTNVHIRSTPGKAVWIDRDSSNLQFDNVRIDEFNTINAASQRPMSNAADGIWGSMTKGNILIQNSQFGFLGDDAINIHTPTMLRGLTFEVKNATTGELNLKRFSFPSPAWRVYYEENDEIGFLSTVDLVSSSTTRTVVSAAYNSTLNGGTWTLELDDDVPTSEDGLSDPKNIGIVNRRHLVQNVIVRNVVTRNHRARGILLQSQNAVIEKCQLTNVQVAGILIRSSGFTQEGVGVRDVLITNNHLNNVDINGAEAAIVVDAVNAAQEQIALDGDKLINNNVTLTNNLFENTERYSILASSVGQLVVRSNRISIDPASPWASKEAGQIRHLDCPEAVFERNSFCPASCRLATNWISIDGTAS
ncbi:pectin lyase fold/virulence factor [Hyaloraphidium curvatum]|nr:pectin lyase fold/virulence factor [Hyaloraphidium curvatum]